jgi:hypothetical protein
MYNKKFSYTTLFFQTNASIQNQLTIRKHSVSNMFTQATLVYYHFSNYIIRGTNFTRGPAILRGWQFFSVFHAKLWDSTTTTTSSSFLIHLHHYHSGLNFPAVYVELLNRTQFMSFNDHQSDEFLCQEKSNLHPYA